MYKFCTVWVFAFFAAVCCGEESPGVETDIEFAVATAEDQAVSDAGDVVTEGDSAPEQGRAEISWLLEQRLTAEARNRTNRFVLTPHNRNYLLPVSYRPNPNTTVYEEAARAALADQQRTEIEFQFSVKVLIAESLFGDNGHLYMAYTNHSFWQAYHQNVSRPFRETNHEPELILSFANAWTILGFRNTANEVIINHQSNGQSGQLSRSWNRIMVNSVFERNNFAFAIKPWYRIPEGAGEGPDDPKADNNPGIEHYLGHFELLGAYKYDQQIINVMLRNNLRSDNRGAVEINWSFPISSTVRGYVKYFNGYGHSLIDYDSEVESLGIGITFTDLF